MEVQYRYYQEAGFTAIRAKFAEGFRSVCYQLGTGGGKTVVAAGVIKGASAKGRRVMFLAHRKELIRQASRKLSDVGVQHGIISPGFTPTRDTVQVASVQTLVRRIEDPRFPAPDLIIIDECHHAVAGQWASIIAAYPQAKLLGITATPIRLDGKGLGIEAGGCFDALVLGPSVAELMAGGFLSPTRVFAPAEAPDLSGIKTVAGDYAAGALAQAMERPKIVGDAISHYARYAPGQPAILFSPSVA